MLWRRLRRKPAQTLLVLLSLFFASAAITLSLSAYLSSPQFRPEFANRFELTSGWTNQTEVNFHPMFLERDLDQLKTLAPAIERLAIFGRTSNFGPTYPQVGDELYQFPDEATVSAEYFDIMGMTPRQGSFFTEADRGDKVVVISEGSARMLFGNENPVGQTIGIPQSYDTLGTALSPRIPFTVIGTFADADIEAHRSPFGYFTYSKPPLLYPSWSQGTGPITDVQEMLLVQAREGQEEEARSELLAAVRQVYASQINPDDQASGRDFYITEPGESFNPPANFIDPSVVLFGIFGIVALLTSTIGVFSALLSDVLERTHEFGVRRALGASRRRVVLELASGAASLALVGSVLGILAATLLLPLMTGVLAGTDFSQGALRFRPFAALAALGLSVGLSFLLSLFPAYQAVRRGPIENLRYG